MENRFRLLNLDGFCWSGVRDPRLWGWGREFLNPGRPVIAGKLRKSSNDGEWRVAVSDSRHTEAPMDWNWLREEGPCEMVRKLAGEATWIPRICWGCWRRGGALVR